MSNSTSDLPADLPINAPPPPRLLFRFTASKSKDFPHIMESAYAGDLTDYEVEYHGRRTTVFQASFHLRTSKNTKAASSLALWLCYQNLAEAYGNGYRISPSMAHSVLDCYSRSWCAPTVESYCWKARPAQSTEGIYEQIFTPITYLVRTLSICGQL